MLLRTILLTAVFFLFPLIVCDSPYDPFNNPENAIGAVEFRSSTGIMAGGILYDTTEKPLTLSAMVFLPAYIDSGTLSLHFDDGTVQPIPTRFFSGSDMADRRSFDTALTFRRGGTIVACLKVFTISGSVSIDSSTIILTRAAVRLSGLSVDDAAIVPALSDTIFSYTVTVPDDQTMVTIRPRTDNPFARIMVEGDTIGTPDSAVTLPLPTGDNTITVTTVADDDSTSLMYTISIRRLPGSNAILAHLSASAGVWNRFFDSLFYTYALNVADSVDSIAFTVRTSHPRATVSINNKPPATVFALEPMKSTEFDISVTAEDGSTVVHYMITAQRGGSEASQLALVEPSAGQLFPPFHPDTLNYELRIPSDIAKVRIRPTVSSAGATVTVNSTTVDAGMWSQDVAAVQGNATAVLIEVLAQNKKQQTGYRIIVNRAYVLTVGDDGHGVSTPHGSIDAFVTVAQTLHARPDTGYHFAGWKTVAGSPFIATPNDTATAIKVYSSSEVKATFALNRYNLKVTSTDHGTAIGSAAVEHGIESGITATPESGAIFFQWMVTEGSAFIADSSAASTTVILKNGNATVQAVFATAIDTIRVISGGNGVVGGSGPVARGIARRITAKADSGYHFLQWRITAGNARIIDSTSTVSTATLDNGNATVEGLFERNRYDLSVTTDGGGAATGSATVPHGGSVTITAAAKNGFVFDKWEVVYGRARIADSTVDSTTVVLNDGDAIVIARFVATRYLLAVISDGGGAVEGGGTVTHGVPRTIIAVARPGNRFVSWHVNDGKPAIADTLSDTTTATLEYGSASVMARFQPVNYRLFRHVVEGGILTIPDSATHGVATAIRATAASGYHFVRWEVDSGIVSFGNPADTVTTATVTGGNAGISGVFALNRYVLLVSGDGNGTTLGSDTVNHGAATAISATPSANYRFNVWRVVAGIAAIADSTLAATTVSLSEGNAEVRAIFISTSSGDTLYVDSLTTYKIGDGKSWLYAFRYLQDALAVATSGSIICIARGTYYAGTTSDTTYFKIDKNIRLLGGYPNHGGARNLDGNTTVLSGRMFIESEVVPGSRQIIRMTNVDSTCILDGLAIADGRPTRSYEGALSVSQCSPTIRNCTFTSNISTVAAGAAFLNSSSARFDNCRFTSNQGASGGAISARGTAKPRFSGCRFVGNRARTTGGAVQLDDVAATFVNCSFDNDSSNYGGAVCAFGSFTEPPLFQSCLFVNNASAASGGAMQANKTGISIVNCTFSNNRAQTGGGAVATHLATPVIANCTFTGNSADTGGAVHADGNRLNLYNSIIWGNTGRIRGQLVSASISDTIKNCVIQGGFSSDAVVDSIVAVDPSLGALGSNGGPLSTIPIVTGSSAHNKGTGAVPVGIDISTDARGSPRSDGKPDIGAFEVQ